jgi:hypothetical protein
MLDWDSTASSSAAKLLDDAWLATPESNKSNQLAAMFDSSDSITTN